VVQIYYLFYFSLLGSLVLLRFTVAGANLCCRLEGLGGSQRQKSSLDRACFSFLVVRENLLVRENRHLAVHVCLFLVTHFCTTIFSFLSTSSLLFDVILVTYESMMTGLTFDVILVTYESMMTGLTLR